jgi:esterase/lipase superfamily enzyme
MELKVYGHAGKPVVVFPSACGRFYEFEDFGMVDACRWFIEQAKIQLYAVDSVDGEAWLNQDAHPADRGRRHQAYDAYIVAEVIPFIQSRTHGSDSASAGALKLMSTGCSMGAYHAAQSFFRHPDVFDTVIALSGLYGPHHFVGDYMEDDVYFNFPLLYLPNLTAAWYLDQFRESKIIVCVGQGDWEEACLAETRALEAILTSLDVPAWVDYWGYDVNHDWPWWRKQLPYFLGHLNL